LKTLIEITLHLPVLKLIAHIPAIHLFVPINLNRRIEAQGRRLVEIPFQAHKQRETSIR
jgi:hypothetical protein